MSKYDENVDASDRASYVCLAKLYRMANLYEIDFLT